MVSLGCYRPKKGDIKNLRLNSKYHHSAVCPVIGGVRYSFVIVFCCPLALVPWPAALSSLLSPPIFTSLDWSRPAPPRLKCQTGAGALQELLVGDPRLGDNQPACRAVVWKETILQFSKLRQTGLAFLGFCLQPNQTNIRMCFLHKEDLIISNFYI